MKSKSKQIVKINKDTKIIYLEGISLSKKEYECLLPINSLFNIDHPLRKIKIFDKKTKHLSICPDEYSKEINVSDISLITSSVQKL